MDLSEFIRIADDHAFTRSPCLYIIRHPSTAEEVYRCGASGTKLYQGSDLPYGSDASKQKGIVGRCNLYLGFWYPLEGQIHAALRIKQQLVATAQDRTATDAAGNLFNVDRGSKTLVLAREKEFHAALDRRGYRRPGEIGKELFKANSVRELIAVLRQIRGEELYLFTSDSITEDTRYNKGKAQPTDVLETQARTTQPRERKEPTVTVRLSKQALEQLRSSNQGQFDKLVELVLQLVPNRTVETVRVPKQVINLSRDMDTESIDSIITAQATRTRAAVPPTTPAPTAPPAAPPAQAAAPETIASRRITRSMAAAAAQELPLAQRRPRR